MARLAVLLVFLVACAPPVAFAPYRAQYATGAPTLVKRAVLAYEGDIETLTAAGAVLIGWLDGYAHGERNPRKEAARVGGTHVVLVERSTHSFVVGMECVGAASSTTTGSFSSQTTGSASFGTMRATTTGTATATTTAESSSSCAAKTVTTTTTRHAVMRLEPGLWDGVVAALRPTKGLPPALAGCSCSDWGPYGSAPAGGAYLECPGAEEARLASEEEYLLVCDDEA